MFSSAFTGFETNNKYKICNSMGQQVYFAAEGNAGITSKIFTTVEIIGSVDPHNVIIIIVPFSLLWENTM